MGCLDMLGDGFQGVVLVDYLFLEQWFQVEYGFDFVFDYFVEWNVGLCGDDFGDDVVVDLQWYYG